MCIRDRSETTAEQGEEPAAAENPAEPAQDTAEEPDPLVPGRAEDADPDTTCLLYTSSASPLPVCS